MNFTMAAIAGAAAFLLSFLAGLLGGVGFFDIVLRALFWGAFGFGGALGVEALLKALVPDLFELPASEGSGDGGEAPREAGRAVDITLEDDGPAVYRGVVEEVDEEADEAEARDFGSRVVRPEAPAVEASPGPGPEASGGEAGGAPGSGSGSDEELPDMGSFLDAFKPGAAGDPETAGSPAAGLGEFSPEDSRPSYPSSSSSSGNEEEDPAVLAKAIQTVMKRDAQGN